MCMPLSFCAISDLVMTLTFVILTSKYSQFTKCIKMVNLVKFPQAVYKKILCSQTSEMQ